MSTPVLHPGDVVDAVVTAVTPFGVFVRTATGIPGLVRGGRHDVDAVVRLRVVEFDAEQHRFSGTAT